MSIAKRYLFSFIGTHDFFLTDRMITFHRVESARQVHEDRSGRQYPASMNSTSSHEHVIRRNQTDVALDRENGVSYKGRPRPRTHHYAIERPAETESSRPRPRSFYEELPVGRDFREQRNPVDQREVSWDRARFIDHVCISHSRLPDWTDTRFTRAAHAALAGASRKITHKEHNLPGTVGTWKIPWTRSWKCQTSVGDGPSVR